MLQELCPRCGSDRLGPDRACDTCGFDPAGERRARPIGVRLGPLELAAAALGAMGLAIIALGVGLRLGSPEPEVAAPPAATPGTRVALAAPAEVGRVRFAERLGDGLALEAYRTQFSRGDTIAWRAEFVEPPESTELTIVIAWTSARETMQLSRDTVTLGDPTLSVIGRDEVPVADLVPTAGLYLVAYYDGERKLAEGVFELLPPER